MKKASLAILERTGVSAIPYHEVHIISRDVKVWHASNKRDNFEDEKLPRGLVFWYDIMNVEFW